MGVFVHPPAGTRFDRSVIVVDLQPLGSSQTSYSHDLGGLEDRKGIKKDGKDKKDKKKRGWGLWFSTGRNPGWALFTVKEEEWEEQYEKRSKWGQGRKTEEQGWIELREDEHLFLASGPYLNRHSGTRCCVGISCYDGEIPRYRVCTEYTQYSNKRQVQSTPYIVVSYLGRMPKGGAGF